MEAAAAARDGSRPADFHQWILSTFGEGIAELFLLPYNFKVWAFPPDQLGIEWMGDRVAVPDLERVRRNVEGKTDDVSWGPNSLFRFPKRGGTGAIWKAVARRLPPERLRFGARIAQADASRRHVTLESGERLSYDTLISALPLDALCAMTSGLSPAMVEASKRLLYSTSHIIGIGLRGGQPETLARKCWMYFPEDHSPYYRVTVFSNYSPANVPEGEGYWSLMAEVSESPLKPVRQETLVDEVITALRIDRLISPGSEVVSRWSYRAVHGYPTPSRTRDQQLALIEPELVGKGIFSRGRFGAWRYEVSNQDHSFMQGVEAVDRLLGNGRELTLNQPDLVNSGAFLRKRP
jgi:Protoporphyrinogen oxidase